MARFRFGVGLLLVLLGLCLWAQVGMARLQSPIRAEIARAEACAAGENWTDAAAAVARARQGWQCHRTLLAALADHQPLEDIEALLAALTAYAETQEQAEFQAGCRELLGRLQAMEDAHTLEVANLL